MTKSYPLYICLDCGLKYGTRKAGVATWYPETCGVCGIETICTEPRDFGHLVENWRGLFNE